MGNSRSLLGVLCIIFAIWCPVTNATQEVLVLHKKSKSICPTGFANFGDSLTDTGNVVDLFPFFTDPENSPYGDTFFGEPAKRFSNGRLVPDFFSLAFGVPLLEPYMAPTAFDYRHGINFAVGGAAASQIKTAAVAISLSAQATQFIRFKNSAKAISSQHACAKFLHDLPIATTYSNWLYTITIGGNDILSALIAQIPPAEIVSTVIPDAVNNITAAVKTLYGESARKFLIFNVPPQGCATIILTLLGSLGLPLDNLGCIAPVNQLNSAFNAALLQAIVQLRTQLPNATISLFDYNAANIEILTNPATYGFNPNKTKTACCGTPGVGTLNYNPVATCGHPALGSTKCANPEEYVNWDGVHFTEHFYRLISKFALSGNFTNQGVDYKTHCNLDFSRFGSSATYKTATKSQGKCNTLFD